MNLCSILLVKEWLSRCCSTEDVDRHFREALKNDNRPIATLALAELIKRGHRDLIVHAIQEKQIPEVLFPENASRLF